MSKIFAIIPTAGSGTRFKAHSGAIKQYYSIANKPIIEWTLEAITSHKNIYCTIVVIAPEDDYDYEPLKKKLTNLIVIKQGGAYRAETVNNGITYLTNNLSWTENDIVIIHDAARCCIRTASIDLLISSYLNGDYDGAILATPISDSIKHAIAPNLLIDKMINRENLYAAQTPQLFKITQLKKMLEQTENDYSFTDEASLFTPPYRIKIIINPLPNPKITYLNDIKYADFLLTGF